MASTEAAEIWWSACEMIGCFADQDVEDADTSDEMMMIARTPRAPRSRTAAGTRSVAATRRMIQAPPSGAGRMGPGRLRGLGEPTETSGRRTEPRRNSRAGSPVPASPAAGGPPRARRASGIKAGRHATSRRSPAAVRLREGAHAERLAGSRTTSGSGTPSRRTQTRTRGRA